MKTTAKILLSSLLACMILLVSCGDTTPYAILRAHIRENGTEDGEVCIF